MRVVATTPGKCEVRLDHCRSEDDGLFDLYLRVDEEAPARDVLVCMSEDNLRDLRKAINDLLEEGGTW